MSSNESRVTSHESRLVTGHESRLVTGHESRLATGHESPLRIGIFRALQLGDLLCSVPAWRALRLAYPQSEITLIGLPWARDFARRFARYVDAFIEFPGAPGLPERKADPHAYPAFLDHVRDCRFDLLVQMHGSGELTNPLLMQWGAARLVAFHRGPETREASAAFLAWEEHEQEVRRNLRLAAATGAPSDDTRLEFPLRSEEEAAVEALLRDVRRPYVCVHPGARYPSRRWPAQRFAAVADTLAAGGLEVIVTGAAEEKALALELMQHMRHPARDLTGRTSLGTFAALVKRARLVVSNDTGMSHVATAVGATSVIVSSGADARRWRPLGRAKHRMLWHDAPCRPCGHRVCPTGHECALGVTVEAVLAEARALLEQETVRAA